MKSRILLVDDNPVFIQLLIEMLSSDYEIAVATNGESALRATAVCKPDLILLDIKMPGMSGFDVCETLKKDQATNAIPVIFVTAADEAVDEARGLEIGGEDYLIKPVSPPVLKARVRNTLERAKLKNYLESLTEGLDFETLIGSGTTKPVQK
ncbi:MAG: response regulator [Magnetococcales bacterium]|nr:response regulator [Magnetococcales bacterium]